MIVCVGNWIFLVDGNRFIVLEYFWDLYVCVCVSFVL